MSYPQNYPQYPNQPHQYGFNPPNGGYPGGYVAPQRHDAPTYTSYPSPNIPSVNNASPPPNPISDDLLTFTKVPKVDPVTSSMIDDKALQMALKRVGDAKREEGQRSAANEAEILIIQAKQEHFNADGDFELGTSAFDNVDVFGYGIVYYFELIKFLAFVALIFSACQIALYAVWANETTPIFQSLLAPRNSTRAAFLDLFITRFEDQQFRPWIAINIVLLVLTFLSGPTFFYYARWRISSNSEDTPDEGKDKDSEDRVLRLTDQLTIDVSQYYRSQGDLIARRVVSWSFVVVLLGAQVVAAYFITTTSSTANLGVATAIAIVAAVLNFIFQSLSGILTEFEKWQSYGRWKVSQAAKLLIFRFGNVVTIYAATDYAATRDQNCTYDVIGQQFLMLLIIEIAVNNIVTLSVSYIRRRLATYINNLTKSPLGIRDTLPQFDLAFIVLNLAYRQYVLVMAMVVFPLSIAIGFIGFFIQYWVEKILLFRICGQPRRIGFNRLYLSLLMFFVAALAIGTPFAGAGFMLSGVTRNLSPLCQFPP